MNLLAIDAASSVLSVAVCHGEEIFHTDAEPGMRHSELIMDLIDTQMKNACLAPNDLNGVLCMGGPGSFTGLRIGYSVAKGLALSLSIPFVPIPTLECMAHAGCGLVMPVIEAGKNSCFYALFRDGKRLLPDTEAGAEQIAAAIKETPDAHILKYENHGYAKYLIEIAKQRNIFGKDNSAHLYLFTGPEYIKKTDAELLKIRN